MPNKGFNIIYYYTNYYAEYRLYFINDESGLLFQLKNECFRINPQGRFKKIYDWICPHIMQDHPQVHAGFLNFISHYLTVCNGTWRDVTGFEESPRDRTGQNSNMRFSYGTWENMWTGLSYREIPTGENRGALTRKSHVRRCSTGQNQSRYAQCENCLHMLIKTRFNLSHIFTYAEIYLHVLEKHFTIYHFTWNERSATFRVCYVPSVIARYPHMCVPFATASHCCHLMPSRSRYVLLFTTFPLFAIVYACLYGAASTFF